MLLLLVSYLWFISLPCSYSLDPHIADKPYYIDLDYLNSFGIICSEVIKMAKSANFQGELWLGETADTDGGGLGGVSDTYLSGFM